MRVPVTDDPLFAAYVLVYVAAAVACVVGARHAGYVEDADTRRGLVSLALLSAAWAAAEAGYLLGPTTTLRVAAYTVGLVVGFAAVGAWLYLCSAYTGRSVHRNATVCRVAVAVFCLVVAVKVTNPWHHLYFTTRAVSAPFPHLAVHHGALHWVTMGGSYALAAVGYAALFEWFTQVSYDTRPLVAQLAVTGLPALFDLAARATPALVALPYEPLGVAVFTVGVVFTFRERFQTVRVTGGRDAPVVVLTDDDEIREFNAAARRLFPALDDVALGTPLASALPEVADAVTGETAVISRTVAGETRHYQVSETPFTAGGARLGRVLGFVDVTESERYRLELERQNERLEEFASVVSHDLRNPLNVARGRLELAREEGDAEDIRAAERALARMETIVADVLALARQGQPVSELEPVSIAAVAEESWGMVETGDAALDVRGDLRVAAEATRLQRLFENLFRNSVEHGATSDRPKSGDAVTVTVGPLDDGSGFYVADDGPGVPASEREAVFESGYTTAPEGTGFGLAIVSEIAAAHDWSVRLVESEDGGARFEVTGVAVVE